MRTVILTKAAIALLWLFSMHANSMRMRACAASFDIREHLSTKAPYVHRRPIKGAPSLYDVPDPAGYKPVFVYLLTRHGSRWPTEKRMKQINGLQSLFQAANSTEHAWMRNWTSPMHHILYLAGELHPAGEAEMMGLARRLRHRFLNLTAETYAPRRYPIISTQVPRAAQSASAFALGFFGHSAATDSNNNHWDHQHQHRAAEPKHQHQHAQPQSSSSSSSSSSGSSSSRASTKMRASSNIDADGSAPAGVLSSWLPQPVAINMLPKRHDPVLRFFEMCRGYREHEDWALRWLAPWMHSHLQRLAPRLESRMGLPRGSMQACHVDALWQLCSFEAGLMSRYDGSSSSSSGSSSSSFLAHLQQQQQQQHMEWRKEQGVGHASKSLRSSGSRRRPRTIRQAGTAQAAGSDSSSSSSSSSNVCQLFTPEDAALLEWLEDVRLYETQGYGAAVNYEIAAPLLADITSALLSAAAANAAGKDPLQRARMQFAHCETLTPLATLLGLFKPAGDEAKDIPQLPGDRHLQAAVGVSSEQVEADLQAVDEVTEDLPLIVMGKAAGGKSSSSSSSNGDADESVGSVWQQQVGSETLAETDSAGVQQQQQQGQQQQQQQQEQLLSQFKRRKLSDASSAASTSAAVAARMEPAASHPTQQQQQQQQHKLSKHHHGPAFDGCSYKGRPPLDSSLLLPPPPGWLPIFLEDDTERVWRGGRVAPLGANLVLVLYGRDSQDRSNDNEFGSSSSSSGGGGGGGSSRAGTHWDGLYVGDHRVRLVYNEQVIPLPGCSGGLDCSLQEFLEVVVGDKTSKERFSRHCLGSSLQQMGVLRGMGQQLMYGASSSSSSSSTGESKGSSSARSGNRLNFENTAAVAAAAAGVEEEGLEVFTADGLPLLLHGAGNAHAPLWY